MSDARPNILFIMADQMAASVLPIYGGQVVKSPHLNALADGGVVFDSAYCNSPLCAPSRFVLMTGRLPSVIGAYDNAAELRADTPTFAHYLRNLGYHTALSGKMHFCGPDQLHGFEHRLTSDIYPADFGWSVNWDDPAERPTWYHDMSSVVQAGPAVRTNQLDYDDEVVFHAQRYLHDRARSEDGRPFCLTVSMTHPHDPYAIPEEYWNRYQDDEIDLPSLDWEEVEQDPHSTRLRSVYQADVTHLTEAQVRNARRAYYGAISYVDDQIGRLRDTLKATGLDKNTIIVFSGDHGDMLGERGLWYKMSWFEGSARVPLIVHAPDRFRPHRVSRSVSTMDLLPTFLDLVDGPSDDRYATKIEGCSLLLHLRGDGGHDEVIGEYMGEGARAPIVMIRRGDYKFIHAPGDPDQLFNLAEDPTERSNLARDPAHADRLAQFRQEIAEGWDLDAIHQSVLNSQRSRRLVASALSKGEVTSWDHQPMVDASRQYMRNTLDLGDLERRARYPRVE
ncbi:choline-sulfatase [Saccharospirillum salsuginis]|uniref:Choline-sulfatase n=1 Tax=Saccharospirillum salsuginis TaxID=418750 RepID=A0A918N7H2_9GAMM|nr:choline-sulfatase [Saccharospirillum salsuginis]GGX44077.1 choline-sulfatase [Saccharospirillum salsuginis]